MIDVEIASHSISYGGRPSVLAVLQDVTQRKQLEEHLRQAAKMEAVGMLAGGIAHDFNNLLTIINGYSQILLGALPAGDPNYTAAEQIMKAGERAAALTGQLLAFSRGQVLQTKAIDLNQLLGGLETMLRRLIGEDIDLRLAPGRDLGHVRADPGQMEQVVMNLVVNARDAMPRGGVLTIETCLVDLDETYVSTHAGMKPGQYVALVVSDNGTGMDAATLARLFQPFFTTKGQGKGTGLGMTMVFSIVKQSGGGMEVHSEPGKGTSVKVYLPSIDQPKVVEPEAPPAKAIRASETILLVEDEDLVRNLVRHTLQSEGYTVLDAPNAEQARRIVRNSQAADPSYDHGRSDAEGGGPRIGREPGAPAAGDEGAFHVGLYGPGRGDERPAERGMPFYPEAVYARGAVSQGKGGLGRRRQKQSLRARVGMAH